MLFLRGAMKPVIGGMQELIVAIDVRTAGRETIDSFIKNRLEAECAVSHVEEQNGDGGFAESLDFSSSDMDDVSTTDLALGDIDF